MMDSEIFFATHLKPKYIKFEIEAAECFDMSLLDRDCTCILYRAASF